jgi:hypothetical protein
MANSRYHQPEMCPVCGSKSDVEILDDDGQKKFYSCDNPRCDHLTWMQYGFSGKPVISSLQSETGRGHYKALIHLGYPADRARAIVIKANIRNSVQRGYTWGRPPVKGKDRRQRKANQKENIADWKKYGGERK